MGEKQRLFLTLGTQLSAPIRSCSRSLRCQIMTILHNQITHIAF